MPQISPKGCLPYGWIVKTSRAYPDRIYYFNIYTGASVWECPDLDPPRILSEDKKEVAMPKESEVCNTRLSVENSPQSSEISFKPCTPPTAVVVPVIHKQKQETPVLHSRKKSKKKKTIIEEKVKLEKSKASDLKEKLKKKKRKKKKSNPDNNLSVQDDLKSTPPEIKEQSSKDASPGPSSSSYNLKDVEMRDVSMDLLDDLAEKKETVFDTTACYYIVVDTNILIGELHLISELKDTPLDGCGPPHIFIPWVVIEELDKLKCMRNSKTSVLRGATEAIRYLNSVLSKHPRFHGQSPAEAEEWAKAYSKCNDDKILECCMALKDKMPAEKVILLTNDKNLVNKALICKINVHNFGSLMKKVKPDTAFNYEEMKSKKKKKEKNTEELPVLSLYVNAAEEKVLRNKRDICKREIHTLMSNARLFLKHILSKLLNEKMFEAYGDIWLKFPIEKQLLKGLLEAIKKYWAMVFSQFFTESNKRNFELLLEKESRPEGFLGDKEECLVILSAIEDVFRQIQKVRPKVKVPVEQIQNYRVACVNAFVTYCEAESSIRTTEEKSIHALLDTNWNAVNQLCGIILDFYKVPHDFNYEKSCQPLPEFEIRRIMSIFYPTVQTFRSLLKSIYDNVQKCKPVKSFIKKLAAALLDFIPSLRLPYESVAYPCFSHTALERFLTSPQNKQTVETGIKQIEKFYSKLDEALRIMLLPHLREKSPELETMICD